MRMQIHYYIIISYRTKVHYLSGTALYSFTRTISIRLMAKQADIAILVQNMSGVITCFNYSYCTEFIVIDYSHKLCVFPRLQTCIKASMASTSIEMYHRINLFN